MGNLRSNPPIKWPQEIIPWFKISWGIWGAIPNESVFWQSSEVDISLTIWNFDENLLDSLRYFALYLNVRLEMSDQLGVWHLSDIFLVWHQSDNLKLCWKSSRFCQIFSLVSKCQAGNVRPTGGLTFVWHFLGLTSVWQFETLMKIF